MTVLAQVYCTVGELMADLRLTGSEPALLDRVRQASALVQGKLGDFIPITETRSFRSKFSGNLEIDHAVAVTAVSNDTTVLTAADWELWPGRMWANGPYKYLHSDTIAWCAEDVSVTGRWGKYEASEAIGVSAVTQLIGATSLDVSDGSLVSPGMVVLIESEQELVTGPGLISDSTANLGAALDADDDEVTLTDGTKVKVGEEMKVDFERMRVLDITANVALVDRGSSGTKKTTHLIGADVYVYRSYVVQRGVNGTTAAAHAAAAVSRMMVPADINGLTRKVAGLIRMQAAAGFASKSGNAELGETFYYNIFPADFKQLHGVYCR